MHRILQSIILENPTHIMDSSLHSSVLSFLIPVLWLFFFERNNNVEQSKGDQQSASDAPDRYWLQKVMQKRHGTPSHIVCPASLGTAAISMTFPWSWNFALLPFHFFLIISFCFCAKARVHKQNMIVFLFSTSQYLASQEHKALWGYYHMQKAHYPTSRSQTYWAFKILAGFVLTFRSCKGWLQASFLIRRF